MCGSWLKLRQPAAADGIAGVQLGLGSAWNKGSSWGQAWLEAAAWKGRSMALMGVRSFRKPRKPSSIDCDLAEEASDSVNTEHSKDKLLPEPEKTDLKMSGLWCLGTWEVHLAIWQRCPASSVPRVQVCLQEALDCFVLQRPRSLFAVGSQTVWHGSTCYLFGFLFLMWLLEKLWLTKAPGIESKVFVRNIGYLLLFFGFLGVKRSQ